MADSDVYSALLILNIKEGRGFSFAKRPVVIGASYSGVQLYSEPIAPSESPFFNSVLTWALADSFFKKFPTSVLPIRIEFYYHPVYYKKDRFGYIIFDIKKTCNSFKGQIPIFGTHSLLGLPTAARSQNPAINICVTLQPCDVDIDDDPSSSKGRVSCKKHDKVYCLPTTYQNIIDFDDEIRYVPHSCLGSPTIQSFHFLLTFEILSTENLSMITSVLVGTAKEDEVGIMISALGQRFCFRDITGIKKLKKCRTLSLNIYSNLHLLTNYFRSNSVVELKLVVGEKYVGKCIFQMKELIPYKKGEKVFRGQLDKHSSTSVRKKLPVELNSGYGNSKIGPALIEFFAELECIGNTTLPIPEETVFPEINMNEDSDLKGIKSGHEGENILSPTLSKSSLGIHRARLTKRRCSKTGSGRDLSKSSRKECMVKKAFSKIKRKSLLSGFFTENAYPCNEPVGDEQNLSGDGPSKRSKETKNPCSGGLDLPEGLFDCGLDLSPSNDPPFFSKAPQHYTLSHKECQTVSGEKDQNVLLQNNDKPPVQHLDITLQDSLANHKECVREKFIQICAELEDWKERQQEIFRFQLKKNTERHIQKLSHSWMKKQKVVEEDLTKRMQRCMSLTNSLSLASDDLAARTQLVIKREKELNALKEQLSEDYSLKFTSITDASKRYQYEMDHKISLLELEKDNLQKQLGESEKERTRLERIIENAQSQQQVSSEQVASIMIELKNLEEKLHCALESKKFFKEQWGIAVREVHRLKEEQHASMQREIEHNKIELQRIGLMNLINQNDNAKGTDAALANEIRAQLHILNACGNPHQDGMGEGPQFTLPPPNTNQAFQ